MPQPLDLILIALQHDKRTARFDTNGERHLDDNELRTLASLLLDAATNLSEGCPLRPFHDQLVVQIIKEEGRISSGGIAIPDTVREAALRGVILAVGPLVRNPSWWEKLLGAKHAFIEPPKVGDLIAFSPHAGTVTKVGDREYLTMKAAYALTKIALDAQDIAQAQSAA